MNSQNTDKILKDLGDRLKKAREEAKLTQSEVAKATGMNVNYYAQIERGEINTSYVKVHAIGKALNIKLLDIS
ncbi:MAG: helix-turn-helix transcriptional regulator [Patescibacteria group bacterium]|jgi:transcriptional regulator with XRE-family HTH domain